MEAFFLSLVIAAPLIGVAYLVGVWRSRRQLGQTESSVSNLSILRAVDKLILSNRSLSFLAPEVVNLVAQRDKLLGAALWMADPHGQIRPLAVSRQLQHQGHGSLQILMERPVSAEEAARSRSLLSKAIHEHSPQESELLRDVDSPPLMESVADRLQAGLGIKSIAVYPVEVENHTVGAMTFYASAPQAELSAEDRAVMQSLTEEIGIAFANARLTEQLENINVKLEQTNVHLQRIDATKDEFISVASHQLRSPLTAIKGYLSMLMDGDYGELNGSQRKILSLLTRSSNEVINLLNDMLNVSRITAQKFELTRAPVKLDEVIRDVVAELQPLAEEKGVALKLELPDKEPPEMNLDPLRIRQVVINLIDNGIKYTEQGEVQVQLEMDAETVTFKVKDTGIGVPEDELDKMFTKFYRAANARQVVGAGSGLGLFVAKRIIEEHNGMVIMRSHEGRGSTFGFRLPRAAVALPQPVTAA